MRIWIIAENWPPRIGGIERYLTGLASNLVKKGHQITVFAPTLQKTPLLSPLSKGEKFGKAIVIRHRFFYPIIPKWLPFYIFLTKKAREQKPDIILCGKALFEGRVALRLKKKFDISYIICTYGMEIATWQSISKTKHELEQVLEHADHVLAINKKTRTELEALGVSHKKLHILYPGIDPAELAIMNNPDEVLKKYTINKPYILTVSRLVKRKGIDDLVIAFEKVKKSHPEISLVIVGDGPEKKNLEQIAQPFNNSIKFLGALSDEDIHALYSRATLFALPPKELVGDYEGFGIVYCEAAFFGLPVVATRTGGIPEAVKDNETGILVEPGNSNAIADAILQLLDNPALATHYGEVGKQRVLDLFQWNSIISDLEELLHPYESR